MLTSSKCKHVLNVMFKDVVFKDQSAWRFEMIATILGEFRKSSETISIFYK